MAELKAAQYEGDANDALRDLGMEALQGLLDEAVTIPSGVGRHESADTFVPKGKSIQVATEEEWRELNGEYADDAESEEPPGENSGYATPEEMGFGSYTADATKGDAGKTSAGNNNDFRRKVARFKPIPWAAIEPDLEDEDLIDGLVPGSGLIVVYGPPSCGKSFFVCHLALHIAAGLSYVGRETKKAHVVYIASEGQKGFKKRVKAAREALDLKTSNDVWFSLIPVTPNLGSADGDVEALIQAIKEESGPPPGLIVVDTLSRSLCGADENGAGMATFVENCGKLSENFNGVPVLPVHHTGWSEGRTRGWSGLHGATDAEFSIVERNGVRHVSIGKMKDGEDSLGWTFKLNQVEVGSNPKTGKVKTSCVVELLSDPARVDRKEEAGSTGKARVPRSLHVFGNAFNEAMAVYGKPILLTGVGAKSTSVDAVDVDHVKAQFARRWITGEAKDEDGGKGLKRKREQATWTAFKRALDKLPPQYCTETQNGVEYIWRLECKPH